MARSVLMRITKKRIAVIFLGTVFLLGGLLALNWGALKDLFSPQKQSASNVQMGVSALMHGDTTQAVRKLQAAIKLDPRNAEAYYYLARTYEKIGDLPTKQVEEYDHALEIAPGFVEARNALGTVYWEMGKKVEAEKEFVSVLKIDPFNAVANNNMGRIRMEARRDGEAEAFFKKALAANPNYTYALNNLGNLYFLGGRYKESEEVYERSLALEPRSPGVHYQLAKLAERLGKKVGAIDHWQKAIDLGLRGDVLTEARQRLALLSK